MNQMETETDSQVEKGTSVHKIVTDSASQVEGNTGVQDGVIGYFSGTGCHQCTGCRLLVLLRCRATQVKAEH